MDWIRELFAVVFVFGLLLGLVWLARAKAAPLGIKSAFGINSPFGIKLTNGTGGRLAMLDRLALTPANSLHLVRAEKRTFLLSVHSSGVAVLSEWSGPEESER
jgi:Flagellar biosynthesis protein, FliO